MKGRVVTTTLKPAGLAQSVAGIFGRPTPTLEKATLIRRGKPIASTYKRKR